MRNAFWDGVLDAFNCAKVFLFESAAILVGMIFLPKIWLTMWRLKKGKPNKRDVTFVQSAKIQLREEEEREVPWDNLIGIVWFIMLSVIAYHYWQTGPVPGWIAALIVWMAILAGTQYFFKKMIKKSIL